MMKKLISNPDLILKTDFRELLNYIIFLQLIFSGVKAPLGLVRLEMYYKLGI